MRRRKIKFRKKENIKSTKSRQNRKNKGNFSSWFKIFLLNLGFWKSKWCQWDYRKISGDYIKITMWEFIKKEQKLAKIIHGFSVPQRYNISNIQKPYRNQKYLDPAGTLRASWWSQCRWKGRYAKIWAVTIWNTTWELGGNNCWLQWGL